MRQVNASTQNVRMRLNAEVAFQAISQKNQQRNHLARWILLIYKRLAAQITHVAVVAVGEGRQWRLSVIEVTRIRGCEVCGIPTHITSTAQHRGCGVVSNISLTNTVWCSVVAITWHVV